MAVYDREQVVRLIADALAVHDTMIDERNHKLPPLSKCEAYKADGRGNVMKWVAHGQLKGIMGKKKLFYSISELEHCRITDDTTERLNWMDFYHRGIIKDDYDERKNG